MSMNRPQLISMFGETRGALVADALEACYGPILPAYETFVRYIQNRKMYITPDNPATPKVVAWARTQKGLHIVREKNRVTETSRLLEFALEDLFHHR